MSEQQNKNGIYNYNANNIHVALGALKFRINPAQYLGADDTRAIENQLFEFLDNAIDESIEMYKIISDLYEPYRKQNSNFPILPPQRINVTINEHNIVTIEDEGRGLPCSINEQTKIPAIYLIFENDSAGGKGNHSAGGYSSTTSGMHGAGACVSMACTDFFKVTTKTYNETQPEYSGEFIVSYEKGERKSNLQQVSPELQPHSEDIRRRLGLYTTGTKIEYKFDATILKPTTNGIESDAYSKDSIIARLRQSLIGLPNENALEIHFKFKDEAPIIISPKDVSAEKLLNVNEEGIFETLELQSSLSPDIKGYFKGNLYLYKRGDTASVLAPKTVVNRLVLEKEPFSRILNSELKDVVQNTVETVARRKGQILDESIKMSEIANFVKSYNTLLILEIKSPSFGGQTKNNLTSTDSNREFKRVLSNNLYNLYSIQTAGETLVDTIVEKTAQMKKLEEQRAKELQAKNKQKMKISTDNLMQKYREDPLLLHSKLDKYDYKLTDSLVPVSDSFLVLVEGDSASTRIGDTYKPFHILTLGGKPENIFKKGEDEITLDVEGRLSPLIISLKAGYKAIIILTDADSDARHIRILLYALIYQFGREYLYNGNVFVINSPNARLKNTTSKEIEVDLTDVGEGIIKVPVGEYYSTSQLETDRLLSIGGIQLIKKYNGLDEALTDDNDITFETIINNPRYRRRVNPPTDQDKIMLMDVLNDTSSYLKKKTGLTSSSARATHIKNPNGIIAMQTKLDLDMSTQNFTENPKVNNIGYYTLFDKVEDLSEEDLLSYTEKERNNYGGV